MAMQKLLKMLGLAVLSLALLACGGDDDDDSEDTTTTTEPPVDDSDDVDEVDDDETDDTDDTDESDDDSDDAAESAEVTPPGTELAVGDSAVVPYGDSMQGLVEITVTEIVAGDKDAFDDTFGENAEGLDPYYIRYTVEVVSIDPDDEPDVPTLRGTAPDGGPTGTVIVGSVEECQQERFSSVYGSDELSVGDSIETCRLQAAVSGETVGGAEFDEHDDYSDDPVLWFV